MLAIPSPVMSYPAAGAVVAYSPPRQDSYSYAGHQLMTPPPRQRPGSYHTPPASAYNPSATSGTYHRVQEDVDPISPYPELKNLVGALHVARHRDPRYHPPPQSQSHDHGHPHPGQHGHHHPGHIVQTTVTTPQDQRREVRLPDFPFHHWVDDPREHQYRPTYEQMLYQAWEHQQRMKAAQLRQQEHPVGPMNEDVSDLAALDHAIATGHVRHDIVPGTAGPHQLAEPIKAVVEAKRHEAERARAVAEQYAKERGPNDPATLEAQQAAAMAEGQTRGAAAVEHAIEVVEASQALQHINAVVQAFDHERQQTYAVWQQKVGEFGEQNQTTMKARSDASLAAAQWQGACAAQAAPGQRDILTAEHPQAIANRADLAADAFRAEADELQRQATHLDKLYGAKDPRAIQAHKAAELKWKEFQAAEQTARISQDVADGKPLPPPPEKKKPKKKTRSSFC